MQSPRAEKVFEISNVQHLLGIFGTGYDLFPLRISDSLRVLVASWQKAESSQLPPKGERKKSGTAVTLYIQTILIQFKTAVKNTVFTYISEKTIYFILYTHFYSMIQCMAWQIYRFFPVEKIKMQALLTE